MALAETYTDLFNSLHSMNISLKLTSFKIYFKMKLSYTILIFTLFFLLNCQNSKEIDTYKQSILDNFKAVPYGERFIIRTILEI